MSSWASLGLIACPRIAAAKHLSQQSTSTLSPAQSDGHSSLLTGLAITASTRKRGCALFWKAKVWWLDCSYLIQMPQLLIAGRTPRGLETVGVQLAQFLLVSFQQSLCGWLTSSYRPLCRSLCENSIGILHSIDINLSGICIVCICVLQWYFTVCVPGEKQEATATNLLNFMESA